MKIGIVIPWRPQPSRIKPFEAVVDWYKNNLPEAKIYLADRQGPTWNAAASRNDGMKAAEADGCDIVIFNDADTIPEIQALKDTMAIAINDDVLHNPWDVFHHLEGPGTDEFFAGKPVEECSFRPSTWLFCGVIVCTPKAWWKIGGMDEKFKKWGAEDDCMAIAHKVINGIDLVKHPGKAYSLGHELQKKEPDFDIHYNNNVKLMNQYKQITDPAEMLKFVKSIQSKTSLKILAYVRLYVPRNNAGAEVMLHEMLLGLKNLGHEVKVICLQPDVSMHDEIEIYDSNDTQTVRDLSIWADVMFTHLDFAKAAMRVAAATGTPLVQIIHNDRQASFDNISYKNTALIVANSKWIKDTLRVPRVPSIVFYPPTDIDKYKVKSTGDAITLVNLMEAKGAKTFWQLARILPDKNFIAVEGGYGSQVIYKDDLPNVTFIKNTPDINSVYEKTRILLMPSSYESWGRVAIEASCSGIPTIANKTPGLNESLGDAGIFVDHTDIAGYVEAIRMLDDKNVYQKYSNLATERAKEIHEETEKQFIILESELFKVKKNRR
jgi:glycosyltransferase involved in cell wall biosynthesis